MRQAEQLVKIAPGVQEVLKPVLYADVFDYPLTFEEIYQFIEVKASPEEVKDLLVVAVEGRQLVVVDGYYCLAGRQYLAATRRERQQASARLWPKALRYGRWLAGLPFIRMVTVTGSLAVDNVGHGIDDIDFLIVTQKKRLWLCRAMIILLVRFGHTQGVDLCPNYIITENKLDFENDLFAAREMLQMKPLYGAMLYRKMWELNPWVTRFFPQGIVLNDEKLDDRLLPVQRRLKQLGELVLGGFWGDRLENWLQRIQITKHSRLANQRNARDTVLFTPDVCKGHYDGHRDKTMMAYRQRAKQYNL